MKTIAVYVRVSTRSQDTRSQEPDVQRWLAAYAGDTTVQWYRDKGSSGKTMDRPAWGRLEQAIRAGRVSTVLVWRLDRLGRTASGLTALFDELVARRVNLVSIKDGLDLQTPAGRLMANVLASVAQYELEVRGERVRAGIDRARAAGKRWGGSKPGRRGQRGTTDAQRDTIRRLHAAGTPKARIAAEVRVSRPTVYAVLAAAE